MAYRAPYSASRPHRRSEDDRDESIWPYQSHSLPPPSGPLPSSSNPSTHRVEIHPQDRASTPPTYVMPLPITEHIEVHVTQERHRRPMVPNESRRYQRGRVQRSDPPHKQVNIKAMSRDMSRKDTPADWSSHIHPDGALYFHHQQKEIMTDAFICHPTIRADVIHLYEDLQQLVSATEPELKATLVLECLSENTEHDDRMVEYGYYFVDHDHCTLFWPQEYRADFIGTFGKQYDIHQPHLKYALEWQYWLHCGHFPESFRRSKNVWSRIQDLKGDSSF